MRSMDMRRAAVVAAMLLMSASTLPATQGRRVVRVSAERFAFRPSEISVRVGETVEFRFTSEDTSHGFHIAGTDTGRTIPKRGQGEVVFVFTGEKPGRFEFECNRMCGAGHDFMRGQIIVKPETAPAGASPEAR